MTTQNLNTARKGQILRGVRVPVDAPTRQVARVLKRELRRGTPRKSGKLQRSLVIRRRARGKFTIHYRVRYAKIVYNLHRKRGNDWIKKGVNNARRILNREFRRQRRRG